MSDDLPGLRASHEDRDRVVEALRVAGGDGRLSAEELEARLGSALTARTLGELAGLTADLPVAPAAKEVLVVEQHGGKYVQEGRWQVPARFELRTRECRVVLDFTRAVVTSNVVRIETDMVHGKLFVVGAPDIVIDADGLALTYSKLKLRSTNSAAPASLAARRISSSSAPGIAKPTFPLTVSPNRNVSSNTSPTPRRSSSRRSSRTSSSSAKGSAAVADSCICGWGQLLAGPTAPARA